MPRYRRHFAPGQTVFLTIACHDRLPWLSEPEAQRHTQDALRDVRRLHPFVHYGHVLLHDHIHLLIKPREATQMPQLVGSFKRRVESLLSAQKPIARRWQKRYFDHVIRDAEDFRRHLDYLHFNPVRHGLVAHAAEWPWSSLPAWISRGIYPEDWGALDPGTSLTGANQDP